MKALPGLTKLGLILILAFCCSAGMCDRKHNVAFLPDYATADQIVLPDTEISEEDAAALVKTLNASNATFYVIQPWEKGLPAGLPLGKLPFPECLKAHNFPPFDKDVEGKNTGVSRTNFSRWSRVIGQGCQTRCVLNTQAIARHHKTTQGSQDLVNAVKQTLQKYQKRE
jgi:hypothetical protein